jgi:hypothetical protein
MEQVVLTICDLISSYKGAKLKENGDFVLHVWVQIPKFLPPVLPAARDDEPSGEEWEHICSCIKRFRQDQDHACLAHPLDLNLASYSSIWQCKGKTGVLLNYQKVVPGLAFRLQNYQSGCFSSWSTKCNNCVKKGNNLLSRSLVSVAYQKRVKDFAGQKNELELLNNNVNFLLYARIHHSWTFECSIIFRT